jgi:hypothetical protein
MTISPELRRRIAYRAGCLLTRLEYVERREISSGYFKESPHGKIPILVPKRV